MSETVWETAPGITEQLRPLEYGSLPWLTHPIDIDNGPQGWGPFNGPYMPVNFQSAKDVVAPGGIDNYLDNVPTNNIVNWAPSYDIISLFTDKSVDLASNEGPVVVASGGSGQSSATISNASNVQTSGVGRSVVGHGFWTALESWVRNVL